MAHANRKTRSQLSVKIKRKYRAAKWPSGPSVTQLGCVKHGKPSGLKKRTDWPVVGPRQNHV